MGGKSKSVTVGYKHYLGEHLVLCHGPIDNLSRIQVDERTAWQGVATGGSISVNAPDLFGGESREGGVSGQVDIAMGGMAQGQNSYLVSMLGSSVPAYRGVVSAILRKCYLGNNPYLKKWSFRGQRIFVRQNGLAQWFSTKAAIYPPVLSASQSQWRYLVVLNSDNVDRSSPSYDDSSWSIGNAPFANGPWSLPGNYGFATSPATVVPSARKVWMRTNLNLSKVPSALRFEAFVDNDCRVYVNGVLALTLGGENGAYYDAVISGDYFNPGENSVAVVGWDRHTGNPPSNWFWFDWRLTDLTQVDMNPAHIIRECLTDPDWGMGYLDADIDDTSFQQAADTLSNEGLGMSLLWDRQITIDAFVQEIVRHIDAALYVDRKTGKFVLKLIRADYDEGDLLQLDESNVAKVANPSKSAFGELINSVTVNYWDAATGKDASLSVQDTALVQMQGAVIGTTMQYPGFTHAGPASIAAQRDLRALSSPFLTCTLYVDSTAKDLNIGDVFKFSWDRWQINEMVMRVVSIAFADGRSRQVRVTCTQDVYSTPLTAVIVPGTGGWVDPSSPPTAFTDALAFEAPYLELVQTLGEADTNSTLAGRGDIGYVMGAAARPDSAVNGRLWTDSGPGYGDVSGLDFCPYAELVSDINKTTSALTITNHKDLDQVTIGTWCQIDNELLRVDAVDGEAGTLTVGRGVLDTVPEDHEAGAGIFFWDEFNGYDPTEYVEGEEVDVKLQPVSGSGVVPLDDITPQTVEIVGRPFRPYPPGNLLINDDSYDSEALYQGELTIEWAHRDRLQQTSGTLLDHFDGDIGPEAGTLYRVQGYIDDELVHTEDDISGTSTTWTPSDEGRVKIVVSSKREDVYSWQAAWHEFYYANSDIRITMEGDERRTEEGVLRVTED